MNRIPGESQEEEQTRPQAGKPDKRGTSGKRPKSPWRRRLLAVLRTLLVPALCAIALIAGMLIGYTVVGDQPAGDVFHWSTWQHMLDLIFAED